VVLAALAEHPPEPTPAWAALSPDQLVDHLEATHHAYLHAEMPRLHALAEKVADVHGDRHPELLAVLDTYAELRTDLEPHLAKEEQILFPMIRELVTSPVPPRFHCGSLRNPISVMLAEHDRAGALLARLRSLTNGFEVPADGCASYRALHDGLAQLEADTHLHVHKENNLLFPAVVALEATRC
jgi:regulator of cell morphogenesis and NO signaling